MCILQINIFYSSKLYYNKNTYFYHTNYVMCVWMWRYISIYMHKEFCHREMRTQLTISTSCARSRACEIQFSWARRRAKSHVRLSPAFLFKQGRYFREIKYSARSIWSFREVWRTLGSHAAHFEGSYFRRQEKQLSPPFFFFVSFPLNTLSAENLSLAFGTLAQPRSTWKSFREPSTAVDPRFVSRCNWTT